MLYYGNEIDNFFKMPLNMKCVLRDGKWRFCLDKKYEDFQLVRSVDEDTIFANFMNFNFKYFRLYAQEVSCFFKRGDEDKVCECIRAMQERIEQIPFIFGVYSVYFIIMEIIDAYSRMYEDEDMKEYVKMLRKIVLFIFKYYKIDTEYDVRSCIKIVCEGEKRKVIFIERVFEGITPFVQMGKKFKDTQNLPPSTRAWVDCEIALKRAREICFDIFLEWKRAVEENHLTKRDDKIYQLNLSIERYMGSRWVIWKRPTKDGYTLDHFGNLFSWILGTLVDKPRIAYCINCCTFFAKKNNRQLYCSENCRRSEPWTPMKKLLDQKKVASIEEENMRQEFYDKMNENYDMLQHYKIGVAEYWKNVYDLKEKYGIEETIKLDWKPPRVEGAKYMTPIFTGKNV